MSSTCPSVNDNDSGSNDRTGQFAIGPEMLVAGEKVPGLETDRVGNRAPTPFVWQHGTQLILLDDEPGGWVMAELRFDTELCRYVEVRRAIYEETREAIGAVLSRSLSSGDHAAVDTALSLHDWLHTYYGISILADVLTQPDSRSIEFTV